MSDDFVLGADAKLYLGAKTTPPVLNSLVEVDEARDVTLDPTFSEIDVTTRAGGGVKSTATSLTDISIDGELLFQPGNTNYGVLRDAALSKSQVSAACLTGDKSDEDSEGPLGLWSVTKLTQPQPLDGALMVQFTLKIFSLTEWVGGTITS